ncbi:hypothetical protein LCI18_004871 [Fusarium solani-melongenae]|uniref:Uncharacterized protein n=1 Tax=Fusarium solani subsp. cucurbitae TaxID=2747967 RepID=A0ACD3YZ87_FUSSC|nr:hypothetical protein LCI18_004871 [Fusarium solani-melongenae]
MSGYGYGPPPPPPSASAPPSYGPPAPSYPQHGQGRGGAHHGRGGRGGHYNGGRGDYHGSPQGHYEYSGQPYPPHHNAPPYGGSHPPAGTYPPPQPQWGPEHGHPPPHGHSPAPMSSNNYHPNYAPQPYPPSQYPQQPPYGGPQPYPYQGPPPPPNQSQWGGQGQPPQNHYGNGRPRGGYSDRGGPKPPMNGPIRPGYEHEGMAPPVNGYGQPYPHDPRAPPYPPAQYPYPGPPPPPGPPHQDGYYGHNRRGRGGFRDGNSRGRGGYHGNDKPRHHNKSGHNDSNHNKPEPPTLGKKKKRKMNTLGLTPGMDSESEDDEGEEKILTELIGQETIQIQDVAAFLAERKKHFPTKARVEAKKAAELAQNGEDKASSLEKQADKLRRQLRKVESSIKRKREQGDEGDEMRDPSEESSDDEPEVMSTRSHVAPPPPPPAKKADVSKHCKYYSTGGTCGKKGKCRFVHDPEVREAAMKEREANNGRLTIQQRLILNDKEQEDLTVLQSIDYLRKKGAIEAVEPSDIKDEGIKKVKAELPAQPPPSSLLPDAPASLPPPPVKREPALPRRNPPPSIVPGDNNSSQGIKHYQGWLLRPYGSTNGKSSKSDDLP